ncbi:PrsW family intramembrane metalloprotease [Demequina sp. TTPB684]|uniref:PrsW family glutamic-type intramembrane protease n=1 Tax=unclassified Demequina TaxID=2620311 RepID=UPI001CF53EF0|nr:PrsW family glutamic-type intramembrane protease [Demequina sp. TMPB413]MCB2413341.1 PrsW family intramembrane metalloprotease [Demequina sp. TTPB684]UPU87479.1 PrsW family intramembrane metalloprotease [Demequina sp. TMPB413]
MRELTRKRFAVPWWAPRRAGWWLLVVACVAGAVSVWLALEPGWQDFPTVGVTALVLTVPLAVTWWWLLRLPQLWARIAPSAAVASITWGAAVAAGIYALPSNSALITVMGQRISIDTAQAWGPGLIAPLTEETGKAMVIGVVLLAAGQRLRTPMDAALLAGFAGVGFTLTEDVLYAFNIAYINLGENQVISTVVIYFVRAVLFGAVAHAAFAAFVGAGLGYLLVGRDKGRVPLGIALILLGPVLHGLWNSPWFLSLWLRALFLVVVPFLVWWVLWAVRRSEYLWFRRTLAEPGVLGAIPPAYLDAVRPTWWQRRKYRASVVRTYGRQAMPAQRATEAELTDLADAVAMGDDADAARLRATLEARLVPAVTR